jgi:hypothetical protein
VEMQLLGVNDIRRLSDAIRRHVQKDPLYPRWLAKACPIARSRFMVLFPPHTHTLHFFERVCLPNRSCAWRLPWRRRHRTQAKIVFVLLHDLEGHGSRGNVVAAS